MKNNLNAKMDAKDGIIEGFETRMDVKDGVIESLKTRMDAKDSVIEGLKTRMNEKDGEIMGLKARMDEKNGEIEGMGEKIDGLEEQTGTLRIELQDETKERLDDMNALREVRLISHILFVVLKLKTRV